MAKRKIFTLALFACIFMLLASIAHADVLDSGGGDMLPDERMRTGTLQSQSTISPQPFAFVAPMSCPIGNTFRADYKGHIKPNGNTVGRYGGRCEVGDYIELIACDWPAGIADSTCIRIFDDDYEKVSSDDSLNLRLECGDFNNGYSDGITDCFGRDWFMDKTRDKYIGYNCKKCNENSETEGRIYNLEIVHDYVEKNKKFMVMGAFDVWGPVNDIVIETGIEAYGVKVGSTQPFNLVTSQSGACGDDKTVGVKISINEYVNTPRRYTFILEDFATVESGIYNNRVYLTNGCYDELVDQGETPRILASEEFQISVAERADDTDNNNDHDNTDDTDNSNDDTGNGNDDSDDTVASNEIGQFTAVNFGPANVKTGDTVQITGTFKVENDAEQILIEAHIDETSYQAFSVIESQATRSKCDTSQYYAGDYIQDVKAGDEIEFSYIVRAPVKPATYKISAHAHTECASDGGQLIAQRFADDRIRVDERQAQENDRDGDEVLDATDNCISVPNKQQTDTDNDGFGNACDTCPQTQGVQPIGCPACYGQPDCEITPDGDGSNTTNPGPDACSVGDYRQSQCEDGTQVVSQVCLNGEYVPYRSCGDDTDENNLGVFTGLFDYRGNPIIAWSFTGILFVVGIMIAYLLLFTKKSGRRK